VDRLLGGGKETRHGIPNRSLTEIELKLVSRITGIAIERLEKAWSNICDLKLKVLQVESNPQLVQIVPPNEVIVLVSFEITIGEMRGIMNLCVPFNTIEPLSGKLSSDSWSAYTKRVADSRQQLNLETGLSNAGVEMVVQLAETNLSAKEIANLCVGDVIMTEMDQNEGLRIFVEGRPLFLGSPGVVKGHKAVQIGDMIVRPKDLVEGQLKQMSPEERESPQSKTDNNIATIA
jgi:flagellar motor switch protein FliM